MALASWAARHQSSAIRIQSLRDFKIAPRTQAKHGDDHGIYTPSMVEADRQPTASRWSLVDDLQRLIGLTVIRLTAPQGRLKHFVDAAWLVRYDK